MATKKYYEDFKLSVIDTPLSAQEKYGGDGLDIRTLISQETKKLSEIYGSMFPKEQEDKEAVVYTYSVKRFKTADDYHMYELEMEHAEAIVELDKEIRELKESISNE